MTKARTIADLGTGFVNISDSGTAGTKVASGTTGQRGSTAGQIRFNTTTGLAEYYTGTEFKVIDAPPTITAVSPLLVDSNAGGNITFTITGSNFGSGAVTKFIGNDATEITASTTTVNSSSSISAIIARSSFVNAKEPYDVKVLNTSGLSGILDNQISVDTPVAWSTSAGTLGTFNGESSQSITLTATDSNSDTITYSILSGSLPSGLSLNSSTGVLSGTLTDVASQTTSTFTIRASTTDANADRAFSITVNPAPYSADFLVIAGGGGGGSSPSGFTGGAGGAGGYRNSYLTETSGGGGSSETSLTFTKGTVYTITVGGGGTGGASGTNGLSSSISGTGITTITSSGGGKGANGSENSTSNNGSVGGSGGGGGCAYGTPATGGTGGSGTANQGFGGGQARSHNSNDSNLQAGGGGGASAVGGNGGATVGGTGGAGLASSITGSSVTRAGGGGGGTYNQSSGSGGAGGGGGGFSAGSTNTGGGGGTGSSGGSGVVILRMPTAKYSGTTTGSPTVTTDGTDKVLVFNASGSYTG